MLDEGCIELMHSGQTAGQAGANPYRVQIIDIKPIKNPQSGAADRYRLVISDGRHYMQARHSGRGARWRAAAPRHSKPHPNRPRSPPFARPPEAARASALPPS